MEKSIEQTFAELDELLEKLESPDTTPRALARR